MYIDARSSKVFLEIQCPGVRFPKSIASSCGNKVKTIVPTNIHNSITNLHGWNYIGVTMLLQFQETVVASWLVSPTMHHTMVVN